MLARRDVGTDHPPDRMQIRQPHPHGPEPMRLEDMLLRMARAPQEGEIAHHHQIDESVVHPGRTGRNLVPTTAMPWMRRELVGGAVRHGGQAQSPCMNHLRSDDLRKIHSHGPITGTTRQYARRASVPDRLAHSRHQGTPISSGPWTSWAS